MLAAGDRRGRGGRGSSPLTSDRVSLAAVNGPAVGDALRRRRAARAPARRADRRARSSPACCASPSPTTAPRWTRSATSSSTTLAPLEPRAPRIPLVSAATGELVSTAPTSTRATGGAPSASPSASPTRSTALLDDGCTTFRRGGAAPGARALDRRVPARERDAAASSSPRCAAGRTSARPCSRSLGTLYAGGRAVRLGGAVRRRVAHVALPAYPWQRERHWFDARRRRRAPTAGRRGEHPLLGRRLRGGAAPLGGAARRRAAQVSRRPRGRRHDPVPRRGLRRDAALAAARRLLGHAAPGRARRRVPAGALPRRERAARRPARGRPGDPSLRGAQRAGRRRVDAAHGRRARGGEPAGRRTDLDALRRALRPRAAPGRRSTSGSRTGASSTGRRSRAIERAAAADGEALAEVALDPARRRRATSCTRRCFDAALQLLIVAADSTGETDDPAFLPVRVGEVRAQPPARRALPRPRADDAARRRGRRRRRCSRRRRARCSSRCAGSRAACSRTRARARTTVADWLYEVALGAVAASAASRPRRLGDARRERRTASDWGDYYDRGRARARRAAAGYALAAFRELGPAARPSSRRARQLQPLLEALVRVVARARATAAARGLRRARAPSRPAYALDAALARAAAASTLAAVAARRARRRELPLRGDGAALLDALLPRRADGRASTTGCSPRPSSELACERPPAAPRARGRRGHRRDDRARCSRGCRRPRRLPVHRRLAALRGARASRVRRHGHVRPPCSTSSATRPSRVSRPAAFDLVVAANVVHATADLRRHARRGARPARAGRSAGAAGDHASPALARRRLRADRGLVALRRRAPSTRCSSRPQWSALLERAGFEASVAALHDAPARTRRAGPVRARRPRRRRPVAAARGRRRCSPPPRRARLAGDAPRGARLATADEPRPRSPRRGRHRRRASPCAPLDVPTTRRAGGRACAAVARLLAGVLERRAAGAAARARGSSPRARRRCPATTARCDAGAGSRSGASAASLAQGAPRAALPARRPRPQTRRTPSSTRSPPSCSPSGRRGGGRAARRPAARPPAAPARAAGDAATRRRVRRSRRPLPARRSARPASLEIVRLREFERAAARAGRGRDRGRGREAQLPRRHARAGTCFPRLERRDAVGHRPARAATAPASSPRSAPASTALAPGDEVVGDGAGLARLARPRRRRSSSSRKPAGHRRFQQAASAPGRVRSPPGSRSTASRASQPRRARADPRRHRRRRPRRDPGRARRSARRSSPRRAATRSARYLRSLGVEHVYRLALARFADEVLAGDGRPRRRRRPELARRRGDRAGHRRARAVRPLRRDRQARHLRGRADSACSRSARTSPTSRSTSTGSCAERPAARRRDLRRGRRAGSSDGELRGRRRTRSSSSPTCEEALPPDGAGARTSARSCVRVARRGRADRPRRRRPRRCRARRHVPRHRRARRLRARGRRRLARRGRRRARARGPPRRRRGGAGRDRRAAQRQARASRCMRADVGRPGGRRSACSRAIRATLPPLRGVVPRGDGARRRAARRARRRAVSSACSRPKARGRLEPPPGARSTSGSTCSSSSPRSRACSATRCRRTTRPRTRSSTRSRTTAARLGLPALAIHWGVLADVGYVAPTRRARPVPRAAGLPRVRARAGARRARRPPRERRRAGDGGADRLARGSRLALPGGGRVAAAAAPRPAERRGDGGARGRASVRARRLLAAPDAELAERAGSYLQAPHRPRARDRRPSASSPTARSSRWASTR